MVAVTVMLEATLLSAVVVVGDRVVAFAVVLRAIVASAVVVRD